MPSAVVPISPGNLFRPATACQCKSFEGGGQATTPGGERHYYARFCLEKDWNQEEAKRILEEGLALPNDNEARKALQADLKALTP